MEDRATMGNGNRAAGDGVDLAPGSDVAAELARARERIAFYEGFDRLIQENIARSGDLLRQAAEQRETAIREVDRARAELDRRRAEQRATLTLLAEELLGLQQRVGDLTRRVMATIDDLGTLPAVPRPIQAEATVAAEPVATEPVSLPALAAAVDFSDDDAPAAEPIDVPAPSPVEATDGTAPPAAERAVPAPTPAPAAPASGAEPEAAPPEAATTVAPDATGLADRETTRSIAVVVHGVPRAAAALALQRHLHGLPHVAAVEAREYAAGVLRLQVTARAPLALEDLRGWDGGADLEPVNVLLDVVEVKLPSTVVR